jgi:NAD(P)-dependent dehydrogenase (short-subunit alcohol dehydrogenase family)
MQSTNKTASGAALITGGASGIGAAAAELLAREGYTVVVTDVDEARGAAVVESIARSGAGAAVFMRQDVASESDWIRVISDIQEQYGELRVLVNNAAVIGKLLKLEDLPIEEWRHVTSINLDGTFLGVKHGIRAMKHRGGSIVNISSVAGIVGAPLQTAYSPSKAGVHVLTKCAALECAHLGYDIRVNSVHPGYIDTPMASSVTEIIGGDRFKRRVRRVVPVGRMGEPNDIAEAIVFLAGGRSKYMTGSAMVVDGGWTAQ